MTVLSLTFHTPDSHLSDWQNYLNDDLPGLAENLFDVEKYMLATVDSGMVTEGQNTNLLLFFENEEKREDFLEIELKNIEEHIAQRFGDVVMVFQTKLNPSKIRF